MMWSRPGFAFAAFTAAWMVEWVQPVPDPTLNMLASTGDAIAVTTSKHPQITVFRFTTSTPTSSGCPVVVKKNVVWLQTATFVFASAVPTHSGYVLACLVHAGVRQCSGPMPLSVAGGCSQSSRLFPDIGVHCCSRQTESQGSLGRGHAGCVSAFDASARACRAGTAPAEALAEACADPRQRSSPRVTFTRRWLGGIPERHPHERWRRAMHPDLNPLLCPAWPTRAR